MITKKMLFLLAALAFTTFSAFAQEPIDVERRIYLEEVTPGAIIKDGKVIEGYIGTLHTTFVRGATMATPWKNQDEIRFIAKEMFETLKKVKNKNYTKYSAKDIEGYRYDTLVYESVKYADLSAVGFGMLGKMMFMRKVSNGNITLFHHFNTPPAMGTQEEYEDCANKPNLVYRKGTEGKLGLVNSLNIKKELADCPMVVDKHEKGQYNIMNDGEQESSRAGKLLNNALFRDDVRLAAIEDYNNNCNQ